MNFQERIARSAIIQEIVKTERYIQEEMAWIAKCTSSMRLRDNLLLATLEEYCLRPVRNQPLIAYRSPKEWETYWQKLTPIQQTIVTKLKAGKTLEAIAIELNWKLNPVMREWSQIYLKAQAIRKAASN